MVVKAAVATTALVSNAIPFPASGDHILHRHGTRVLGGELVLIVVVIVVVVVVPSIIYVLHNNAARKWGSNVCPSTLY